MRQLQSLLHPQFAATDGAEVVGRGLAASPGAAVGEVVFDAATATAWVSTGREVVLVRPETSADDVAGMIAATAVVTARGGLTSHAAVVARGLGRTCVTGVVGLEVDVDKRSGMWPDGTAIREGDLVSVDGTTGILYRGPLTVRPSDLAAALRGEPDEAAPSWPACAAVDRLLRHADRRRSLGVRANAETGADARLARIYGADGIGLCRTEHMLLGSRRLLVENLVTDVDRDAALDAIASVTRTELDVGPASHGRRPGRGPTSRPAAARVPARPGRTDRVGRRRGCARAAGCRCPLSPAACAAVA